MVPQPPISIDWSLSLGSIFICATLLFNAGVLYSIFKGIPVKLDKIEAALTVLRDLAIETRALLKRP